MKGEDKTRRMHWDPESRKLDLSDEGRMANLTDMVKLGGCQGRCKSKQGRRGRST